MKCCGNSMIMVASRKMSSHALKKINVVHSRCNFKQTLKNVYILYKKDRTNSLPSINFSEVNGNKIKWNVMKPKYTPSRSSVIPSGANRVVTRAVLENRKTSFSTSRHFCHLSQHIENLDSVDYLSHKKKNKMDPSVEEIDTRSLEFYYDADKLVIPNKFKKRARSTISLRKLKSDVNKVAATSETSLSAPKLSTADDMIQKRKHLDNNNKFRQSIAKSFHVSKDKDCNDDVKQTFTSVKYFKNADLVGISNSNILKLGSKNNNKQLKVNNNTITNPAAFSQKKKAVYKSPNGKFDCWKLPKTEHGEQIGLAHSRECVRQFHSNVKNCSLKKTKSEISTYGTTNDAKHNQMLESKASWKKPLRLDSKKVKYIGVQKNTERTDVDKQKINKKISTALETNTQRIEIKRNYRNYSLSNDVRHNNDSVESQSENYHGKSKRLLDSASIHAYNIALNEDKNKLIGITNVTDLPWAKQEKVTKLHQLNKEDYFKTVEKKMNNGSTVSTKPTNNEVQSFKFTPNKKYVKKPALLIKDVLSLYKSVKNDKIEKYQVALTCAQPKLPAAKDVALDYLDAEPVPGTKGIKRTTILELLLKKKIDNYFDISTRKMKQNIQLHSANSNDLLESNPSVC